MYIQAIHDIANNSFMCDSGLLAIDFIRLCPLWIKDGAMYTSTEHVRDRDSAQWEGLLIARRKWI